MNSDTLYPALINDEQIVCRFLNHSLNRGVNSITILTTHRLFTRSKHTICCYCCDDSSYTAITLESIHRIDEYYARSNTSLCLILWIFWLLIAIAGVLVSIFLAYDENTRLIGIIFSTIPLIITSLMIFPCICCCLDHKVIQLTGSFGTIKILFEKKQARFFQINLSKQILRAKLDLHQTTISPPIYYLRNEKFKINEQMVISSRF